MRLVSFQITDFRSINDSTKVEVLQRTVLVGRNESGKTALLKALHGVKGRHIVPGSNNPVEMVEFTLARDFPRDRPRSEFKPETVVVTTRWELSDADRAVIKPLWARGASASHVVVNRLYAASRTFEFEGAISLEATMADGKAAAEKAIRSIRTALKNAAEQPAVQAALDALHQSAGKAPWDAGLPGAIAGVRTAMANAGMEMPKAAAEGLSAVETTASAVATDAAQRQAAEQLLGARMPVFVYLDEWDEVPGHHVISDYLTRQQQPTRPDGDRMFDKLLKVADLNAKELNTLLNGQHEERTLLTDRASRVFTKRLQELWKDRDIEVQFRIDAQHFDVLVKDKDTNALVPLDERSRGFRWYFSFFVTFTADTLGGDKENAILLLDEPGLFLHATAQGQLLKFFTQLKNQIVYSTHSPFMIDPHELAAVRTVMLEGEVGTRVSPDLAGDARTLFPLQAALGYDLTQTLFVGTKNVVVEGVTDYWYLSAVAAYLRDAGQPSLPSDIVLTPAGGAQKVSYLVSLLASQNLNVVVLLDTEPAAERTRDDLVKTKMVRSGAVVQVADAFQDPRPREADVEDLVSPKVFMDLVTEAYQKELAGRPLKPNSKVPRVVPRTAVALSDLGITFAKSRVASLFIRKMATEPEQLLAGGGAERFSALLSRLASAVETMAKADREPFK